jgi:asparagine synthase (glutamine-hydrolysing)
VIVYNGEIYSDKEIALDLQKAGRRLRGHADTEVIVEACAQWGVAQTVSRLIGKFAFAAVDLQHNDLYLVRDRLGIKPLYWSYASHQLLFGSELKALCAAPTFGPRLDRNALAAFMRHNYIPGPHTIYQGVHKLVPGTILKLSPQGGPQIETFWSFEQAARQGLASPLRANETETLRQLEGLLQDAVNRRLIADVPLGALLSGGIDSSLVTALMAEQSSQRVKTFSIGFDEAAFNEAPYAKEVAQHLGTDHTELYAEPAHALGLVEHLADCYDEPFADSSQIPTMLVSTLTRKHVTVVLTGDGGDELFAGYNRYALGLQMWTKAQAAPQFVRQFVSSALTAIPPRRIDQIGQWIPARFRPAHPGQAAQKFAQVILVNDADAMYRQMLSHWHTPEEIVRDAHEAKGILWDTDVAQTFPHFLDRMQFLDSVTYLPDDILTKVDRASMRVGLEARVPLLDHRVVEMAWQLPRPMKLRPGESKWALRQLLYKRVPRHLIDRPKMGFGVPIDQWLRGPLRAWAENLLNTPALLRETVLYAAPIQAKWKAHLGGENWAYPLWNVLIALDWLSRHPEVDLG